MIHSELKAQQFTFIEYGLKEGLPQSQARCMMQDSRGFIWIGTLGGLSKFDGHSFINYNRQDGLFNNQINCIIELKNGTIVTGSNGSFSFINGNGVRSIPLPDDKYESTINTLFQQDQMLWIGLEDGILQYSLLDNKFKDLSNDWNAVANAHIKCFHQGKNGVLVLTKEKLFVHNNGQLKIVFEPVSPETVFFDCAETSDGSIWLASKGEGLIQLPGDGMDVRNFLNDPGLTSSTITGITVGKDGQLWLSSRFGFYQCDGERIYSYTEKNGLKTPDIRDIIEDREGNIWMATYGSGILKFTGKVFSSFTIKDGLSSDAVMSVSEDDAGSLWFSTYDKGICKKTQDSITHFTLSELTDNNRIWTSLKDHDGALWFGSSDGLFRFRDNKFVLFTVLDSLSNAMVLSLFEDDRNRLWIGTQKGLTIYQNGKFSPVKWDGAPERKIRCIRQDKLGNLWFACIDGVFKFDGQKFNAYSLKDGLSENSSSCLEIDDQNRIWIGSQNGISIFNNGQCINTSIDETSGSNVVNFLKNYKGRIWIGTNNGLYSIPSNASLEENKIRFRHYGLDDGLRSLETNLNAVFVDKENRFWFGTTEGVTSLNANELDRTKHEIAPIINLTKIQINLQDQDWKKFYSNLDSLTGLAIDPEFKYKQNHLTFYFTGISTSYPESVVYQYMLEGLDEDWKNPTAANFATYSNLPYRQFIFKVRALSNNGTWSDPVSYAFRIRPPFWLTWWFILLEVIVVSVILGFIIYNRRRATKAKREKEWFEMKSRMLALEQQSLNSSMNRHFIFNALNSIQYYINRQDRLAANRYLSDFARLIRKNLDSSEDNLTPLKDEVERLELYLKLEHMRFKDKFDYKVTVDPILNQEHVKVPAMLVQPFLENSIWHGLLPKETAGHIQVDITKINDSVVFTITDNGIGIENSLKNKTTADDHISKGMEITQSRIELIKKTTGQHIELQGPLQIEASGGGETGTLVRLILPLSFQQHFHQ